MWIFKLQALYREQSPQATWYIKVTKWGLLTAISQIISTNEITKHSMVKSPNSFGWIYQFIHGTIFPLSSSEERLAIHCKNYSRLNSLNTTCQFLEQVDSWNSLQRKGIKGFIHCLLVVTEVSSLDIWGWIFKHSMAKFNLVTLSSAFLVFSVNVSKI